MSAVATLAIAADPYLAAAQVEIETKGEYARGTDLFDRLAASRSQYPAFRAAIATGSAVERARAERAEAALAVASAQVEQATVALRHAMRRAEELQRRITGAVEVIDRATGVGPGHGAAVLGNVRLTLTSSRDDEHIQRREAMLSGRHPAGRALRTPTLNDFAD